MDVSDIRYLQIIYVIMEENEPERYSMSRYHFQSLIISGLSGCGFAIHSYDEGDNLFTITRCTPQLWRSSWKPKICGWVLLRTLIVNRWYQSGVSINKKAFNTPFVLKCKKRWVTMLNSYQTNCITQCLNLLSLWRVKDKSPIGNDIQHDSNELLARHQPYLESL